MSDAINPFANVKIAVPSKNTGIEEGTNTVSKPVETLDTPKETIRPLTAPAQARSHNVQPHVMEKIKEAAIEEGYRSDSRPKKETTKTYAYTFYPSDIKTIRRIKMAVMEDDLSINISDSEVMRAAISALKALDYNEQRRLILEQKER